MKNTKIVLVFSFFLVLAIACGTKKNTFVSRNYQALTTKYNVLFNGQEALNAGIQEINTNYKDDWFQILPIEPIEFEEKRIDITEFGLGAGFDTKEDDAPKTLSTFDKAEEKAVKAIQKHSMSFNGKQKNDQIHKAYLLLGKARYYDRRFLPALEAFNFLLGLNSDADVFYEGKLWREKTYLRLGNDELAISNLKPLANNIPKKNKLFYG